MRPVTLEDVDIFFEHQSDPQATAMADFPSREREPHRQHWITKILANPGGLARTVMYGQEVAGNLVSWTQDGHREIGYWIGREYWGRGIASRALVLFLEDINERPLWAYVAKGNAASSRVLEKCGFKTTGEKDALLVLKLE